MAQVIAPPPEATGIRSYGLKPGTRAPELAVPATPDGRVVTLEQFHGQPVVLIFYPQDFTPVCTGEMGLFNELLPEFNQFGAHVLGCSVDSLPTHIAFSRELGLQIQLLADFHPKGGVARRYDVYRAEEGFSERAIFVIDGQGQIFWSFVSPIEQSPGADGVLDALERLTGRGLEQGASP
jgi:peroxiredoxin